MQATAEEIEEPEFTVILPPQRGITRPLLFGLLLCFTLSGMSGLIYEVAWLRSLELVFGTTTFAVATLLAAFMGGLAGGSYVMGRLSSHLTRFHPLRIYALLEVLIAGVAVSLPFLMEAMVPLYQTVWTKWQASFGMFSLLRFGLMTLVLLVPTALMGATLPLLSGFVSRSRVLGEQRIGWLYSCNTLGAVLGCAMAGLVLFQLIGRSNTVMVAVALNGIAALGAWLLSFRSNHQAPVPQWPPPDATSATDMLHLDDVSSPGGLGKLLVGIYAISGFVAMVYEVAWTRALVLAVGSSTYAYTIMLTTFLLGLALGAAIATRLIKPGSSALLAAGLCQVIIALSSYLSVFLVGELPFLYLQIRSAVAASPAGLLSMQFLSASTLLILPTLGLGAMFPITIRGLKASGPGAARTVGWAYALNTLGAIGGAVVTGFWLIPTLGTQTSLLLGVALNTFAALLAVIALRRRIRPLQRAFAAALLIGFGSTVLLATTKWDPAVMSSGVFRYAKDYLGLDRQGFIDRAHAIVGHVLLFEEGLTSTVTVARNPHSTVLMVNGKPDASAPSGLINPLDPKAPRGLYDLPTQSLLGQLPLLLAPQRDEILVIGLGSGVTVGSVLTHPVKSVDCLELEAGVVRGSGWFEEFNGKPLQDPRTDLIINDARNHLLVNDQSYDVIISEPSNPWIPGAANLFTREFFALAKTRLGEQGVFCQWIQLYGLEPDEFQTIVRTLHSVFPHIHMFRVKHDVILVASAAALELSLDQLQGRKTPEVTRDLERIDVERWEELLAHYWIGGKELEQALADGPLNTDDNMLIEFAAALSMLKSDASITGNLEALFASTTSGALAQLTLPEHIDPAVFWAVTAQAALKIPLPSQGLAYAERSMELRKNPHAGLLIAQHKALTGNPEEGLGALKELEAQFPESIELLRGSANTHSILARWEAAKEVAERGLLLAPEDPFLQFHLGRALFKLGKMTESLKILEPIHPQDENEAQLQDLPFYIAAACWRTGRYADSVSHYRTFLRRQSDHAEARAQLADALYHIGQPGEAAVHWAWVARANGRQTRQLISQAAQLFAEGRGAEAARRAEQARKLDPSSVEATLLSAQIQAENDDYQGASDLLRDYLSRYPRQVAAAGYLSELLTRQGETADATAFANYYQASTGHPWIRALP